MGTRRVVTGHAEDGTSIVVSDEVLEPVRSAELAGAGMSYLWGADKMPRHPGDGSQPDWSGHFPPAGGVRFLVFSMPPAGEPVWSGMRPGAELPDAHQKFPGLVDAFDGQDPGMHTTDSTDFAIVLAGEVVLELDEGTERTLSAGDTVVQNGTRHRWANRGAEPAQIAFVLVGTEPRT